AKCQSETTNPTKGNSDRGDQNRNESWKRHASIAENNRNDNQPQQTCTDDDTWRRLDPFHKQHSSIRAYAFQALPSDRGTECGVEYTAFEVLKKMARRYRLGWI